MKIILVCWILLLTGYSFGQKRANKDVFVDTFQSELFLANVEKTLFEYYLQTYGKTEAYGMINELGYADHSIIQFPDSVYENRLNNLVSKTPFTAQSNPVLLKTIKYFVRKRSRYTAVMVGRSKLYFPMFETYLTKHNLPLELKFLPIIESALKPSGKSWAGAAGLWQIMYRTGRSLDLYADSYIDDRLHPEKSTEAACKYLAFLYNLYGNWDLALAGYNCGPGNVNKAIRRAGGNTNYWVIRKYLPKETQMYVPNFYAVMYMMTYYESHQIIPKSPAIYYHEKDSVCLKASVRISHIDTILGIPVEQFKILNPQYKTDIIPQTNPPQCISIPVEKLSAFFELENTLYQYQDYLESVGQNYTILNKKKRHTVQPYETMADIAFLYDTSPSEIREWNGFRNSTLFPGQKIIILIPEKRIIQNIDKKLLAQVKAKPTKSKSQSKPSISSPPGNYKYYTLKSGESLWAVSQKLGISFADIQSMNRGLNPKKMKTGQKIKIGLK